MELRHLRYFVALGDLLHFGRAARRLQIAQPSLSQQISQLEGDLGAKLLDRNRRKVELTEAGRAFLAEARQILARTDHAALVARRATGRDLGRLRVAFGHCMDPRILVGAVGAFRRRYPTVPVTVRTVSVPEQFAALRDGTLEVGFIRPPVTDGALQSADLASEPLVAALPAAHQALSMQRVHLAALAKETFLLVPRDAAPVYHDLVLRTCGEAGFVPDAPCEADDLQALLSLVATGVGVALVPASAREVRVPAVRFRPLEGPSTILRTGLAWRDPSPILKEFVELAHHAAACTTPRGQRTTDRASRSAARRRAGS
jgi:DNA-binding transcriptional LysR family regulator